MMDPILSAKELFLRQENDAAQTLNPTKSRWPWRGNRWSRTPDNSYESQLK